MSHEQNLQRVEGVAERASDAFWNVVGAAYPDVKSGDFGPEETHAWMTACETALRTWLENQRLRAKVTVVMDVFEDQLEGFDIQLADHLPCEWDIVATYPGDLASPEEQASMRRARERRRQLQEARNAE